jgi:hypothetical protein
MVVARILPITRGGPESPPASQSFLFHNALRLRNLNRLVYFGRHVQQADGEQISSQSQVAAPSCKYHKDHLSPIPLPVFGIYKCFYSLSVSLSGSCHLNFSLET